MKKQIYHCWAPSLGGGFSGIPENAWGTLPYDPEKHINDDVVFCGLYGIKDFMRLHNHKGKKWVWWCGSDIRHFINGYWLDEHGKIRMEMYPLIRWMNKNCESWVENIAEYNLLKSVGIKSKICPSFLGDINKFNVTYEHLGNPMVYASVSGDNFKLYGWDVIERIAGKVPEVTFYLYGNINEWNSRHNNVIVRGRVSQKEMNEEIEAMQAGFRPLEQDGCSEIIVKSSLQGQWTISRIKYPNVLSYNNDEELIKVLKSLSKRTKPNIKAREWFINNLNRYPWNKYAK